MISLIKIKFLSLGFTNKEYFQKLKISYFFKKLIFSVHLYILFVRSYWFLQVFIIPFALFDKFTRFNIISICLLILSLCSKGKVSLRFLIFL